MDSMIVDILQEAMQRKASDVFIIAGCPLSIKVQGQIYPLYEKNNTHLNPTDTYELIADIYSLNHSDSIQKLQEKGDDDFSFSVSGLGRFRCNTYKQRGSLAAVLRVVTFDLPRVEELGIPEQVIELTKRKKGLVLVTGPTGSGKSTTLACMIDSINRREHKHIITIEDPLEFIHRHDKSIVSQRELNQDTESYATALRGALRQSPDVILLGEMRDYETMQTALTAAETGQLVLSTLHTTGAAKTIDRIIDVFPANQQQQIRIQLSLVIQAVISQQLIPTLDGGLVPAFEIMIANNAIRNMIRESKVHQMDNIIYGAQEEGMLAMDTEIFKLYQSGKITKENAVTYASNKDSMLRRVGDV